MKKKIKKLLNSYKKLLKEDPNKMFIVMANFKTIYDFVSCLFFSNIIYNDEYIELKTILDDYRADFVNIMTRRDNDR